MADPTIAATKAAQAYQSAVKTGVVSNNLGGAANETQRAVGASGEFSDLVKSALLQAKKIGQTGEQQALKGVTDRTDLNKVVTAVAEAELTLQTVVSIRDKVIDAYKEILRMPM
ncbi:MAG: flagellar hook-basal body complex protein FliE [Rhodospirillales bacterium]|jgi:flagellar hook-basal body complex protein FliE